jgi:hypothetical protein
MKKIIGAAVFMLTNITVYSQADSTKSHKNEISVYSCLFKPGYGAEYAYWYTPRRYVSFGLDINRNTLNSSEGSYPVSIVDSILTIRKYKENYSSLGLRVGTGWLLNSGNPFTIISVDLIGGKCEREMIKNNDNYLVQPDSMYSLLITSQEYSWTRQKGYYAGASFSMRVVANITSHLNMSAKVAVDTYFYHYQKIDKISYDGIYFKEMFLISLGYAF